MAKLKYDAVGLGSLDMALGEQLYKILGDKHITLLSASPQAPSSAKPYIIKETGGVKVGIISFGPPATDTSQNSFEGLRKLYGAYKAAREESDILIVLDQANIINEEWLNRNEKRFGAPDIVIGGAARATFENDTVIGKTHFVPTSIQAKALGVVDVEFTRGQDAKFDVRKIALDEKVAEDKEIAGMIADFLQKSQINANNEGVIPQQGSQTQQAQYTQGEPYYSPQLCKACHEKEYDDWSKTKHATALQTLIKADRTTPECLTCHSTMYMRSRRYITSKDNIAGVDCTTCHIKSLPHGTERANMAKKIQVEPQVCTSCHTKERSPNYNEKLYMPKVAHSGESGIKTAAALKHAVDTQIPK